MAYNSFCAVLISPDGEDHVTDFRQSKTKNDVWNAVDNMGSKWFFYPMPFVVNERTKKVSDVPTKYLQHCVGWTIEKVKEFVRENQDYVNSLF